MYRYSVFQNDDAFDDHDDESSLSSDEWPNRRLKPRKKKLTTRVKWTRHEEKEVLTLFSKHLKKGKCPREKDCKEAMKKSEESNGVIYRRYWETLKKKFII
jgi:hypothetical protein